MALAKPIAAAETVALAAAQEGRAAVAAAQEARAAVAAAQEGRAAVALVGPTAVADWFEAERLSAHCYRVSHFSKILANSKLFSCPFFQS